ncbi:hypothetical protein [Sulfitobacter aestuariivivens]|uniref:hypothetical protein n=1 Tax=Sulfitobacter aestuariivivens TaxID=2766981 RepID=UPI0036223DC2
MRIRRRAQVQRSLAGGASFEPSVSFGATVVVVDAGFFVSPAGFSAASALVAVVVSLVFAAVAVADDAAAPVLGLPDLVALALVRGVPFAADLAASTFTSGLSALSFCAVASFEAPEASDVVDVLFFATGFFAFATTYAFPILALQPA